MNLEEQKNLIERKDWDCLLVLDACRYDFFEKVYGNFLSGSLKKVKSAGSRTEDWLKNTFCEREHKDIIYISANPHINSVISDDRFIGRKIFYEIKDVWDWSWNKKKETVHPQAVVEETSKIIKETEKKIIAHFMQPHWPYLTVPKNELRELSEKSGEGASSSLPSPNNMISLVGKDNWVHFGKVIRKMLGWQNTYRLAQKIGLTQDRDIKMYGINNGNDKLRKKYEENLRIALKEIRNLIEEINNKVIVTADHGEFLGEGGFYGHHFRCDNPILKTVPWLEVS